jgi:hypothetical protein
MTRNMIYIHLRFGYATLARLILLRNNQDNNILKMVRFYISYPSLQN